MQRYETKIRLIAAIGATAVAALGVSSSALATAAGIPELGDQQIATAAKPKPKPNPKPRCQGALVSMGERFGLELYTWKVCGRNGGIPLG